ncbi:MAG: hypothetical protein HKP48_00450 [Winogradskyella sp.]|uniref:acyloxyacyl hydrolase n=1 Tax=Winogradskyella sp. TaxID=1883156 RepID=UPI0017D2DB82|nr:acyloxyacyl hydrolase [Winogradskyella sp.]MBT8245938.1 acyloxyacyl hydrolase [Winogradskyella sp.]NNK21786.1 hypothetical protein [Winogradskyella sp.]
MIKRLLIIILGLSFTSMNAQFIKEKSINTSVGFGLSAPYEDIDVYGSGFYAQGELVLKAASWVDFRPYAGVILTKDRDNNDSSLPPELKSTANAFMTGLKTRIKAPIPYVSPFIEIGVGFSVGSFETVTFTQNINKSGFLFHIPFSLGLELGKNHNVDLAFTYYFHESAEQFSGAFAVGINFPLGK